MEFLQLLIGIVLGVIIAFASSYTVLRIKKRKKAKRVFSPTNYDIRIDDITESGVLRFKLHKAMTDPVRRESIRGTELWDKAASVLGWEELN